MSYPKDVLLIASDTIQPPNKPDKLSQTLDGYSWTRGTCWHLFWTSHPPLLTSFGGLPVVIEAPLYRNKKYTCLIIFARYVISFEKITLFYCAISRDRTPRDCWLADPLWHFVLFLRSVGLWPLGLIVFSLLFQKKRIVQWLYFFAFAAFVLPRSLALLSC